MNHDVIAVGGREQRVVLFPRAALEPQLVPAAEVVHVVSHLMIPGEPKKLLVAVVALMCERGVKFVENVGKGTSKDKQRA
jgi:hypothetical protein